MECCVMSCVSAGQVVEVRALDKVFAVWKKADGTPVCQDAFCLHLGANLAVGGKVTHRSVHTIFHLGLMFGPFYGVPPLHSQPCFTMTIVVLTTWHTPFTFPHRW